MPTFARDTPKEIKPFLGRAPTNRTPLEIHSKFTIDEGFRAYVRSHLGRALDAFSSRIERVHVHFEDLNGRKGGLDTLCRVKVTLSKDEPVVIEEIGTDAAVAFDVSVQRVARNVQRHIDRHRYRAARP